MTEENYGEELAQEMTFVLEWAKSIRDEARSLPFKGYNASDYNKEAHEAILLKYLDFEARSPVIQSLYFVYGDIAESYTNVQDFGSALKYISAMLVLAEKEKDFEGTNKAYKLIINIAAATQNFKIALEYAKKIDSAYDTEKEQLTKLFEKLADNEDIKPTYKFPENILTIRKPKTFKYLDEPISEETKDEISIRSFLHKGGNFSRNEAKKYLQMAKNMIHQNSELE